MIQPTLTCCSAIGLFVPAGVNYLQAVCHHVREHLSQYPPQHIANFLWALATLEAKPDPYMLHKVIACAQN